MTHEDALLIVEAIRDVTHNLVAVWLCLLGITIAVWIRRDGL